MATLNGISGMLGGLGDGMGGNVALSIEEKVLQFLRSNTLFSYVVATRKPDAWGAGRVIYRKIETLQNETYKGSNNSFQEPQTNDVHIDIKEAMVTKYKYEIFNIDRMKTGAELLSQIAATMYMSMSQQLNAALLMFLKYHTLADETSVKAVYSTLAGDDLPQASGQFLKLVAMGQTQGETGIANPAQYGDAVYDDYLALRTGIARLGQIYSKESFGIPTESFLAMVSPITQISLSAMGRNQVGGTISNFQIQNVNATQIAGFNFLVDNMLDQNTPAGTSYNRDYDVNLKGVLGFLIHNEAIAMPIMRIKAWGMEDPNSGNPLFGLRWMYGIGFLRKQLVWGLVRNNAIVDVNNKFITGGNSPINITFDATKTNGDWSANNFKKEANPVAWQQPALITNPNPNQPSTSGKPTGDAEPAAGNTARAVKEK